MIHNKMTAPGRFLGLALLLTVLLLQVGALWAAEVPHTKNSDKPAQGVHKVELEELWRVGGEDDEENIFGIVNRALVDEENNIFLLDAQLSQVNVYSSEGEYIKTLGREGDGPGEFRGPTDMCFLPSGELGIVQAFPGKVIKLALDGTPAGTWELGDPAAGGFFIMRALKSNGGNVVAGGTEQHVDQANGILKRRNFIGSLAEDGTLDHVYTELEHVMEFSKMKLDELILIDSPDRRFDVGADGKTVVAIERNGYLVSVFGKDGQLERTFSREYQPWVRDDAANKLWMNIFEFIQRTQMPGAPIHMEEDQPDVEVLRVAEDGSIWVLTSRAMWDSPEDVFTSYDVFSPDGIYQKKLDMICEGDSREDFMFFAGDDLVFVVTGFWEAALSQFGGGSADPDGEEPEPMEIICYRIK